MYDSIINLNVNIKSIGFLKFLGGLILGYTIKAISEKTNLPPHVLRYYEKEGLLPSVQRSDSGIRHYSDDDLEWLGLICCLKNTGMSIKQIRKFVELSFLGDHTLEQRLAILAEHKRQVEADIGQMQKHLCKVTHKIEYFEKQFRRFKESGTG